MDLLRKFEASGSSELQVAEERLDRHQPEISGANGVVPLLLQSIEEVKDQREGQLLDRQPNRPCLQPLRGKGDEVLERQGVTRYTIL